jgi:ADP-ribose pyrophosphatase
MPKDEPSKLSIIESEVVFEGMIWNVVRETFEYSGSMLKREYVLHPGAVAIIALNEKQEILLIKQYRHPVRERLWEIPAGLLDIDGEQKLEAAKRELMEETGYVASSWEELTSFHTTPGGNNETITIFLAKDAQHVGHDLLLEGEELDMETRWVALSDAVSSVVRGEMRSPSAAVGIMALALRLGVGFRG